MNWTVGVQSLPGSRPVNMYEIIHGHLVSIHIAFAIVINIFAPRENSNKGRFTQWSCIIYIFSNEVDDLNISRTL